MNLRPLYLWLHVVLGAGIRGATTAFLTASAGSTISQAAAATPAISAKALGLTVAMGFAIGTATELNRNPLPNWSSSPQP